MDIRLLVPKQEFCLYKNLIHPAITILTRYDSENGTNLRDILFYYLLNNRSLAKTAAATYMHRNTIVNKIAKIEELVDLDLSDGNVQHRLLFSCQAQKYAEVFYGVTL